MKYWLMKSEPSTFSIDDLKSKKKSGWDGVRNYQARNYMRDEMKIGDKVLFYHSSCEIPGIAGLAEISKLSHPDPTQFDFSSKYFDPKSTIENPRWYMVEVSFKEKFLPIIPLSLLRNLPSLSELVLLQKGSRLSITPVSKQHFNEIILLNQKRELSQ